MHYKTVTILLRIRVRGHFVMSITEKLESHCITVLDNPRGVTEISKTFRFVIFTAANCMI